MKNVFTLCVLAMISAPVPATSAPAGPNANAASSQIKPTSPANQTDTSVVPLSEPSVAERLTAVEEALLSVEEALEKLADDDKSQNSEEEARSSHEARITELQKQLEQLEASLETGADPSTVQPQIDRINQQIEQALAAIDQLTPTATPETSRPDTGSPVEMVHEKEESEELSVAEQRTVKFQEHLVTFGMAARYDSAYVFRGLNVLRAQSQQDQNGILSIGAEMGFGNTGLSAGYWSAYQINGDNIRKNVSAGLGHEQDLWLTFEHQVSQKIGLNAELTYYFYPFATKQYAGTPNPSYMEPAVHLMLNGPVTFQLGVAYLAGLQKTLHDASYLYFEPVISKKIPLGKHLSTQLALTFGTKIPRGAKGVSDNQFHLTFDWTWPIHIAPRSTLTPGVHLNWTNLQDYTGVTDSAQVPSGNDPKPDSTVTIRQTMGDEYTVWFSLAAAFSL